MPLDSIGINFQERRSLDLPNYLIRAEGPFYFFHLKYRIGSLFREDALKRASRLPGAPWFAEGACHGGINIDLDKDGASL